MKFQCCSFDDFSKQVRAEGKEIVMFGAGVLGQIIMPQILRKYELLPLVRCYLDNEKFKWGDSIDLFGRNVSINAPDYLKECGNHTVILLNVSRYADVIAQLQEMNCTEEMYCYIAPMMCIYNFSSGVSKGKPI